MGTETENVSKNDISSTENTISVSTSASIENAEGSNPDSKVDISTTTTTDDTNQENNKISDSKETAEPLAQSDSPIAVPIEDSGRQFDGWSFFWRNNSYYWNSCNCFLGCQILQN